MWFVIPLPARTRRRKPHDADEPEHPILGFVTLVTVVSLCFWATGHLDIPMWAWMYVVLPLVLVWLLIWALSPHGHKR